MTLNLSYPQRLADIEAQHVGKDQWRLVNIAVDGSDAAGLLGFVELIDGQYELTESGRPGVHLRVASLAEARARFVA
ncbi:MAG: hypothetical protein JWR33_2446 [Naasia sp.]|jgi:hypothetical protein|uniref:hypothetical protein n=1 Tax=Naasia sp. TaxID=2546198 RepID=UPI00260BB691|nr:hypothetical protein [Naasia sp.]MCU1571705.1 hypothetical protein [Naasia sp.]